MARVQKFKITYKEGYFIITHRCALGLWKNSKGLLGAVPNRFTSEYLAFQAIEHLAERKDFEFEVIKND